VNLGKNIFCIVAPCILKFSKFTHQQMHYLLTWLRSFKFTLKYTIIWLLHVSAFNDHHQGALSVLHCTQHTCRYTGYILKFSQFTHQQMHYLLTWLKSFKFTLKYTIILLLHVSAFNDHHQGALSVLHCTQHTCRSTGYILKFSQFTHQQMHYLLTWLKSFKCTLKYTIIWLLHVSVFNDHHQGALSVLHCTQHTCRSTGYILIFSQFTHQQMLYLLTWLKVSDLH